MSTLPKVSIIIPCRDQEKTIRQAIDSAIMQDYPNLEIIVSDSGSKDKSKKIIRSYKDKRLQTYFHKNRTRIDNYRGMIYTYMTGELFLNIDGDDYLTDPQYISKAIKAYQNNPGSVLVFAKMKILVEATGQLVEETVNDSLPAVMEGTWLFKQFPKGYSFPYLTCLMQRKAAHEVKFFRKDILSLDWESLLKLILHGKVCFIKENVGVYRRHQENSTKSLNIARIMEGVDYVEEPYTYALTNNKLSSGELLVWREKLLKRYFGKHLIRLALLKQETAKKELEKALQKEYRIIYAKLESDIRYKLFKLVKNNSFIMRLIFKYYVKQEGFYLDIASTKVNEKHRHMKAN